MAQTNYTPISLYYSTTPAATPSAANLVNGELAINIADGKLYYKDSGGVVKLLAGAGGAGIVAGSNTQVQYNNNGVFGASANFVTDGTNVSIGGATISGARLQITGTADSGQTSSPISAYFAQSFSNATTNGFVARSSPLTSANGGTPYTISSIYHFSARPQAFNADSTVTYQYGFSAESTLTGATNNIGFYGNIALGTGRWNLYMNGTANNYMAGSLGIGTTGITGYTLSVGKNITGATTAIGVYNTGAVQSDVTGAAYGFRNDINTQATAFTLPAYTHYYAKGGTIGAGSTVTNQYGFNVASDLTGATNNYGFYGALAAASGVWNLYMNGTASNYLAGSLGIGTTTVGGTTGYTIRIGGNATGSTSQFSIAARQTFQSDVTAGARSFISWPDTAAAAFTLADLTHFYANQGTIGAGSTVTNQYGYYAAGTLTGATNNYGFFGNISASSVTAGSFVVGTSYKITSIGTTDFTLIGASSNTVGTVFTATGAGTGTGTANVNGRWNFFANGTAENVFNGNTIISVNSGLDALRITQTGAGNALLVEDSANPDSTPFVIDGSGRTVIGYTSALSVGDYINTSRTPTLQVQGLGGSLSAGYFGSWSNSDVQPSQLIFGKSKSGTVGTNGIVASGTDIGAIVFSADDGTALIPAASILAEVDATPGTNDMPGRLVFSTTADGASTPTERMRINNAGEIGIGVASATGTTLRLGKNLTGGTSVNGVWQSGTVQSDVTTRSTSYYSGPSTSATAFTLSELTGFEAAQGTIGAGSTVTNQYGFKTSSSLTGATNNYGFHSNIASAANRYNFYAAGTADNYFAGNVGIGTASPASKLHVAGSFRQTGATAPFEWTVNAGASDYLKLNAVGYADNLIVANSSGNVGIGTSSPSNPLTVVKSNTDFVALFQNTNASNPYGVSIKNAASGVNGYPLLQVSDSAGTGIYFRVDSGTGNVGIGTGSPGAPLSISTSAGLVSVLNSTNANGGYLRFDVSGSAIADVGSGAQILSGGGVNNFGLNVRGANALLFGTNTTERARIDSSGNLLVGTTSASAGSRLYVKGSGNTGATYTARIDNSDGSLCFAVEGGGSIFTGTATDSPYNATTGSAANVFVASNGRLQRSTSSLKYKTNVQNATHGLSDLLKLRAVTYEGKAESDAGKTFGGLIAEEVHDAGLTEFVQYAEDGTPDALAYGNMVSLCIKAIQELNAKVEAQAAEIAALKSNQP